MSTERKRARGPFRADQLRSGDPYELSDGHAIHVAPAAGRHADATTRGAHALSTDPDVTSAGVDVGYSPEPGTLRAPDIAIGNVPTEPGWVQGAPPLAVEYADTGQDEDELQRKIEDLLRAGTKYLWVVRLAGARRVEIYEQGRPMRLALPGQQLLAPGVLRNPVLVEALYDPEASMDAALCNLLQRRGYDDLDAVRAESKAEALLEILAARGIDVPAEVQHRIRSCADAAQVSRWLARAVKIERIEELDEQR